MFCSHRHILLILLLVLTILFAVTGSLYAGGTQEDEEPLKKAERLIEERNYNKAIEILTQVIKKDPENFRRAEELMQQVRRARNTYNDTYENLLETLSVGGEEELDEEKAYEVIRKLEELDKNPNEASMEAFSQARRSIVFAVNDRKYKTLMNEAKALLDEGSYQEAITKYLSGFSLHKDLFEEGDYGETVRRQVENRKQIIMDTAEKIREDLTQFQESLNSMEVTVSQQPSARVQERYESFSETVAGVLGNWSTVVSTAVAIDDIRESIQDVEQSDIPYLSTLRILTKGREKDEKPVGIAGAVERPLAGSMEELFPSFHERMLSTFDEAVASYREEALEESEEVFTSAREYADIFREVLDIWSSHLSVLEEFDMERKLGPSPADLDREALIVSSVRTATQEYRDLIGQIRVVQEQSSNGLQATEIETIRQAAEELETVVGELEETRSDLDAEMASVEESESGDVQTETAASILEALQSAYKTRYEETVNLRSRLSARIAELRINPETERMNTAEERFSQARSFVEGVEETINEGADPIEARYPERALSTLSELTELVDRIEENMRGITGFISEVPDLYDESQALQEQKGRADRILTRIDEIKNESAEVASTARNLRKEADLAVAKGDLRLQESRAQLSRNNFERARDKLEQAGETYSDSLSYREDPDVRRKIDQVIPEVADEIVYQQNQQIIREVRNLINRGKELFFQEEFIEAEGVLLRARSRWKVTHTENNPEVSLWIERIRRALETTAGVEISETDPLFSDMMQILNLAKKDYQQGRELYEEGNEEAAISAFEEAEKKIQYIKEPFPNNQEASVLYLKILRYTEPQDFDTIFEGRFNAAVEKLETAPEEAYRELKVLEEIRPDYPRMDDAIYDAEIATGIRQPPPDPQKLAKARDLYRQAQNIVEEDVRARFPVAVTYLNEAIKLDPDYEAAIRLKDQIQAGQGGQVRVVLSSVDQQKLRRAENLFIEARYYEASALVNQLLQDPENKKNSKLMELKRRIESKL